MKNNNDDFGNFSQSPAPEESERARKMRRKAAKLKKIRLIIIFVLALITAVYEFTAEPAQPAEQSLSAEGTVSRELSVLSEDAESLVSQDAPRADIKETGSSGSSPSAGNSTGSASSGEGKNTGSLTELSQKDLKNENAGAQQEQTETAAGAGTQQNAPADAQQETIRFPETVSYSFRCEEVPSFSECAYYVLNDNIPCFTAADAELGKESFETYSDLDELGRCGTAYASIGTDLMPTEARGSISSVKPSGWQSVQYDNVEGKSLYNRCHLIGFQLAGENANKKNLVTGTRYMNVQGMLPFEDMVADYVKETENHVLYRVIPVFAGDELVPRGVTMEARSVEDGGEGICYYVYVYNEQPGIEINFADGTSRQKPSDADIHEYIIGTNTRKFHLPDCPSAAKIKESNRQLYKGTREDLISQGYTPCKDCQP